MLLHLHVGKLRPQRFDIVVGRDDLVQSVFGNALFPSVFVYIGWGKSVGSGK